VIDMGPEGGSGGGTVVGDGTPEDIAANAGSYTGQFLKEILAEPAPAALGKGAAKKAAPAARKAAAPAKKKTAASAEATAAAPDPQKAKRLARKAAALR
jgi:excinuclease ABC subunit A